MAAKNLLLPLAGSITPEAAARFALASTAFSNSHEGLRILADSLAEAEADHA